MDRLWLEDRVDKRFPVHGTSMYIILNVTHKVEIREQLLAEMFSYFKGKNWLNFDKMYETLLNFRDSEHLLIRPEIWNKQKIYAKLLINLKIKKGKIITTFMSKFRLDTTIIAHGIVHSICAHILLLQNFVELPEISINNCL
jgi:hypothetical protein